MKTKKGRTGFSDILKARCSPRDKHLEKACASSSSFSDFTQKADIYKHQDVLLFSSPMEWGGLSAEEFTKHLVEVSDHCLDDPDFRILVDPDFLKSWTNGAVDLEKSEEEIFQDREFLVHLFDIPESGPWQKSLTLEERSDLVHKSLAFVADGDLEGLEAFIKSQARGGKYLRKIPGPGGKTRYIYEEKKNKPLAEEKKDKTIPVGFDGELGGKDHIKALQGYLSDLHGAKISLSSREKRIILDKVVIPKEDRGKGKGDAVIHALKRFADTYGHQISLTPENPEDSKKGKARLRDWYKRHGFVENKGRKKDYEISEAMYRNPVMAEKKPAPDKKEEEKEKKAPPGSQLPEKIQAKLKELGIGKLPQSDIPANTIETDFSDPENKAVIRWKDAAGRGQSGYTPEFHAKNAAKKWEMVSKHRDRLSKVQSDLKKKLSSAKPGTLEHQGLLIAAIIAETGLRPGSAKSLEGRYGVSTLEGEHIQIKGDKVSFSFVGKQGKDNTSELTSRDISKALAVYKKEGALFSRSALIEAREVAGKQGLKLKNFRTIVATNKAEAALDLIAVPPPLTGDDKKDKRLLARAMLNASKQVAEILNNSPAVAAKNYIHPDIFKAWALKAGASEGLFMEVKK